MRSTPLRFWLFIIAALYTINLQAAAPDELYKASGMAQHQQHFQSALKAAQQRYFQQLPTALQDTLLRNSNQRFAAEDMHDRAQARLALAMAEADNRQALSFFNSDLGRKVVTAETWASSPAAVAIMQRGLPLQQLSVERRALIDRLAAQLPALELGVEVSSALTGLAAQSANDLLGGLIKLPQQAGTGGREQLRERMRVNLPQTLAYIYRDLSDDELVRFAQWSESTDGRTFYRATEQAVRDALNP